MAQLFQKGEHVCYGMHGVCLIEDVREISVAKTKDTFYVLRPLRDRHSTFFIPIGNDALSEKMRAPITRDEIDAMIDQVRVDTGEWIEDRKMRMEASKEVLRQADPEKLLRLYVLLYAKKQELSEAGKRMTPSDEGVLKQAEDLIANEFGYVLIMPTDDVASYIKNRLKTSKA